VTNLQIKLIVGYACASSLHYLSHPAFADYLAIVLTIAALSRVHHDLNFKI